MEKISPTKAFFDPTATAESWEKSLSSVSVLVFGTDGQLLVQRNFTDSELSLKKGYICHTQCPRRTKLRLLRHSKQNDQWHLEQSRADELDRKQLPQTTTALLPKCPQKRNDPADSS